MKNFVIIGLGITLFSGCSQDLGRKKSKKKTDPTVEVDPLKDKEPVKDEPVKDEPKKDEPKKDEPVVVVTPPVVVPPVEKPVEPIDPPVEPVNDIKAFTDKNWGRWIGRCNANKDDKTSWMAGFEIHPKEQKDYVKDFVFLTFYYPNNTKCQGGASPNDGDPQVYTPSLVKKMPDDWLLLKGSCRDHCKDEHERTRYIMVRADKFLYMKIVEDETNTDGDTVTFPNGPGR